MRLFPPGKARRKRARLTNYERNVQRILNPPPATLRERVGHVLYVLESLLCRHVTYRALYRHLDAMRPALERAILVRGESDDKETTASTPPDFRSP